ncbi:hypothetical protein AAG570_013914 [Ranatra chinensis]|uniref:non-specific serine/threonine protein kinase n=1 Tax=Ranatra chinensis TaxID=642074 RepID=A0ABD0YQ53_9HEMI
MSSEFVECQRGAEATLSRGTYLGKRVLLKRRPPKAYRHPHLDSALTKERTRAEARALIRARAAGVRVPTLYLVDLQRSSIYMEDVDNGITVKDYINKIQPKTEEESKLDSLMNEIGICISKLHSDGVIHGDLTTSNILVTPTSGNFGKLCFIDFGLSHTASTIEDKAVDLYVMERAMESTHSEAQRLLMRLLAGYLSHSGKAAEDVFKKLDQVRARGRKRTMVG